MQQRSDVQRFDSVLVLANAERPLREKLDAASELAHRNGARLTLFDVVEQPAGRWWGGGRDDDLERQLVAEREEFLREIAQGLDAPDVEVLVRPGRAAYIEVVEEVDRGGHDLVVTAPDEPGRRRLAGAATAMHLLRKCPVPVWVHTAGSGARRGVVVAVGPVDGESVELNTTLLELASSLATRREAPLHVVHAWRLRGESLLRSHRTSHTAAEVDEMARQAEEEARGAVSALVSSVPGVGEDADVVVAKGTPADVVLRVLDHVVPQTLVIGTLSRTGVRGMIMGNTAERVLGLADCSVLAVKPPGFVSPVLG